MAAQDTQPPAQPERQTSRDTVVIACKLPHGIVLHADQMVEVDEPVMGGGSRKVKKAQRMPGTFTVAGNAYPENGAPRARIESGFALSYGCPKDLWDRWLESNRENPMVKNGLIFAHTSERSAVAETREKEDVRSGFERLDPTKLPRGLKKATAEAV